MVMGERTRTAAFAGSVTVASPATQVAMGVSSAEVNVADVINASPGSNDHPPIQRDGAPTVTCVAAAGIVNGAASRLKAAAAPGSPPEEAAPDEAVAGVAPVAPVELRGCPPSTHAATTAISAGVNDGSLAKAP